jgi:hypothetical protein
MYRCKHLGVLVASISWAPDCVREGLRFFEFLQLGYTEFLERVDATVTIWASSLYRLAFTVIDTMGTVQLLQPLDAAVVYSSQE